MNFTSLFEINRILEGMAELSVFGRTEKTPDFYRPFHFVAIALALKNSDFDKFEMTERDARFIRYASRMRLWHALGHKPPVDVPERDHAGRFHPLTALQNPDTVDIVSADLSRLFNPYGNESVRSVDQAVTELVGNCYAHSNINKALHGFVCAQRWPNANKAQIAIGDAGIGIRSSLMASDEYRQILQTANSCELAARYEVTSKRGKGHSGYGLTLARDLIQNNGGAFFLISNDEYYMSKGGHSESGNLGTSFAGTLLILEWNTHVPLSTKDVYDSWPSPDGDDYDDDFNF